MKKTLLSLLVCLPAVAVAQTETNLCINEIMQSNIDCLLTEHDFPDSWVELYNPTDADISLKGYYLGATSDVSSAYQITTDASIASKGYLLIYCDKGSKDLHTNFRLESTSLGKLYLFDATKKEVATLSYPAMLAANIAYGRSADGAGDWGWELTPTPGTANGGGFSDVLLPEPVFSQKGQLMTASGSLTVSMPQVDLPADTKLYVTTDGKEPTKASQSGTEFTFNLNQTTVVRAKLISDEAHCRRSTSHSYIFHPRATDQPIVSILTDDDYLYSASEGILSDSKTNNTYNYDYDWRRPVNAEYFDAATGTTWFNQVGEIAVGGNATRGLRQKSLKLYANKRFGTKRYNGVFWEEKPDVKKVKSFMLRNGGNFSGNSRINDAITQRISGTALSNLDYQAYSGVIVYINGVYKGIFGLRERHNEDYTEANYGIEDVYLASHYSYLNSSVVGKVERDKTTFSEVFNLYYNSTSSTYEQMDAVIDIDNFMKAMIAEMFSTNTDYPQNNITIWKPIDNSLKWRWILYDMDFSFSASSGYDLNMFKYMLGSTADGTVKKTDYEYQLLTNVKNLGDATKIYKKMMSFPKFRETFIDAFATYLGDFMKPAVTLPMFEQMKAELDKEIEPTFQAYNPGLGGNSGNYTLDGNLGYNNWINYLGEALAIRPALVYQHMADYFNTHPSYDSLGVVIPMTLRPNGASVTINDIELTKGNFDGAYFSKRNLRLNSGSDGTGWKMQIYNGTTLADELDFPQREITVLLGDYANCDSVAFEAYSFDDNDFQKKIKELGITYDNVTDWSQEAAVTIAEPRYAYANITCDNLPTTKTDNLHAYIDLYDNNGNFLRKKILLNLQGSAKEKKNLSVSFCEDDWLGETTPAITFGDWVPQDEFHLKGFLADGFRGTAEVAYQFYSKVTQRSNCFPKAFPVSLYVNGNFYGIMAWQLKKHRSNMGLVKDVAENVWLDGTLNNKRLFQNAIDWTKFEVRNPKNLYNMDGTEYDGDNPQEIIDETSSAYTGKNKMVRCATAKKYIINLSKYCTELQALEDGGATEEKMREEIQTRFDVPELINYKVFSLVTSNYDGFSKNWQWFTYDGVKWTVAPYDCNHTFGYNDTETSLYEAEKATETDDYKMQANDSIGPMTWIKKYFWDDVKARYAELRDAGTISTATIMDLVNDWHNRIGEDNYAAEWAAWPQSPCVTNFTDSPERVENWLNERIALEDKYLGYAIDSVSYTLTITQAEWATLCLPFAFEAPEGLKVYTVSGVADDGVSLVLDEVATPLPFIPYLVNAPQGEYLLEGESVEASGSETLTNGLLVGTLDDTFAPADTYVLQRLNEILGFYHVSTEGTMPVSANRAYLVMPTVAKYGHFRIVDDVTSINTIQTGDDNDEATYNLWGQKSEGTENGFLIKRMPDGSHRKVFVK